MPSPNSRDEYPYKYGEWGFPILLWELRMPRSQHNPRVLAFLTSPRKIVLLRGIKKIGRPSNAIPKADIAIAIGRMNDYQERRQRS